MTENTEKPARNYRTKEAIIADYEAKIAKHEEQIRDLEAKIEATKHPKPRLTAAVKMKMIVEKAKAANMTPEEIAERLGFSIDSAN